MTTPDPSSASTPGPQDADHEVRQGQPAGESPLWPEPDDARDASEPGPGPGPGPGPEATEEELQRAWEEQLKHVTVTDVLVQTAVTLVNLAGRRLGLGPDGEQERDLDEVRDGIDAVRALVPVLERGDLGHTLKPLRDALSQLQIEYAKLATQAGRPPQAAAGADQGAPQASPQPPAGPDPASRLWVPGR
ncbi:MAG TPA: hypothetical protein VIJ51_16165 [Solirubrobacteraceae bacterium]